MKSSGLKFSDIVARAKLDRSIGQYVLSRSDILPHMPVAGRQGMYRIFSVEQALRLSICTEMIKLGLTGEKAGLALEHCERMFRRWSSVTRRTPSQKNLFAGDPKHPWIIQILNREFVLLLRMNSTSMDYYNQVGEYLSLDTQNIIGDDPLNGEPSRSKVRIDASHFRDLLEK